MSALCQKQTHAVQQFKRLFDYLVGGREQAFGYRNAKRLARLAIDHELKFGWQLHRELGGSLDPIRDHRVDPKFNAPGEPTSGGGASS